MPLSLDSPTSHLPPGLCPGLSPANAAEKLGSGGTRSGGGGTSASADCPRARPLPTPSLGSCPGGGGE